MVHIGCVFFCHNLRRQTTDFGEFMAGFSSCLTSPFSDKDILGLCWHVKGSMKFHGGYRNVNRCPHWRSIRICVSVLLYRVKKTNVTICYNNLQYVLICINMLQHSPSMSTWCRHDVMMSEIPKARDTERERFYKPRWVTGCQADVHVFWKIGILSGPLWRLWKICETCLVRQPFLSCLVSRLPSGKLSHSYGKSPFSMGKSTINHHFQ